MLHCRRPAGDEVVDLDPLPFAVKLQRYELEERDHFPGGTHRCEDVGEVVPCADGCDAVLAQAERDEQGLEGGPREGDLDQRVIAGGRPCQAFSQSCSTGVSSGNSNDVRSPARPQ